MRYIALLRGINVGVYGRIRMDALKLLMEQAGFSRVATFIQSGNVLFDSDLSEQDARETIERALKDSAGITTTAVLRTLDELHRLVRDCPFTQEQIDAAQAANLEGESFHVCLLNEPPDAKALKKLESLEQGSDVYVLSGRTIYLLLKQSIRTSQLAIRLTRIFPNMTSRNWNTTTKLNELSLQ
jgi:uncharacterized protein (DUF1697 family)